MCCVAADESFLQESVPVFPGAEDPQTNAADPKAAEQVCSRKPQWCSEVLSEPSQWVSDAVMEVLEGAKGTVWG